MMILRICPSVRPRRLSPLVRALLLSLLAVSFAGAMTIGASDGRFNGRGDGRDDDDRDDHAGYAIGLWGDLPYSALQATIGVPNLISDVNQQHLEFTVHDGDLNISNRASYVAKISVFNRYTSRRTSLVLGPGESDSKSWSLTRTSGWYDLAITVDGDSRFAYHLAGHLENGEDSITDPIMGGLV